MRKKNIIVIILTVLIFLSAAVLGFSAVYRVDEVLVVAPVVSQEAKSEAEILRGKLLSVYEKQSIFSADDTQAKSIVAQFPYFHMTSFEKDYPNRIVVTVEEDDEIYAVENKTAGSYYILGADGTVLGIRADATNRADGAANVLITGTPALTLTGEKGQVLQGDEALGCLFAFCLEIDARLNGIRTNVSEIEVLRPASDEAETIFRLHMREGVTVYVRNPSAQSSEKAKTAMDKYLSLSDAERLVGAIYVFGDENGIGCNYYERDEIGSV